MKDEEYKTSKLTVLLPYRLRRDFKTACTDQDTEMSDEIRRFMEKYIADWKSRRRRE